LTTTNRRTSEGDGPSRRAKDEAAHQQIGDDHADEVGHDHGRLERHDEVEDVSADQVDEGGGAAAQKELQKLEVQEDRPGRPIWISVDLQTASEGAIRPRERVGWGTRIRT
jgi:hypothetical protein